MHAFSSDTWVTSTLDVLRSYGLMRIWPGVHSPLRVAVPKSGVTAEASTMVSSLRSESQSSDRIGRHHMGPQEQVGDAEQAAVEAVLPGVGVLPLGVVVPA
jgi:hypothetical protein